MFAKLMLGAAAVLAAALFGYLGDRLIHAYGDARYASGIADGQLQQLPGLLAANAKAAQTGMDARDRVIAADRAHDAELGRLLPQILSAQDKVTAYAASAAGRAVCLDPDRVRGIEDDRAALFPAANPAPSSSGPSGPVPANAAADPRRP